MLQAIIPKSHSEGQKAGKKEKFLVEVQDWNVTELTAGMNRTGMDPAGATADGKAFLACEPIILNRS